VIASKTLITLTKTLGIKILNQLRELFQQMIEKKLFFPLSQGIHHNRILVEALQATKSKNKIEIDREEGNEPQRFPPGSKSTMNLSCN
jgi:hypothetical protein